MTLVVDASALIEILQDPGPSRPSMVELHEIFRVCSPAFVAYELGNVLHGRKKALFGIDADDRSTLLEEILTGIDLDQPDAAARARTGRLAEALGLTFYDAAYLELTDRLGPDAHLLTDDDRLYQAAIVTLGEGRVHRSRDPTDEDTAHSHPR